MTIPWIDLTGATCLTNVTLPACFTPQGGDGMTHVDVALDGTRLGAVTPHVPSPPVPGAVDCDGGMVWPCPTDLHTHLDKGHVWPRTPNPDGTFLGALNAVGADRTAHWSAEDVAARMEFALACAHAHGTRAIRTHLDSVAPQHRISFPVFARMRERWKGRIALQAVALFSVDRAFEADELDDIARTAHEHGGLLGPVAYPMDDLDTALDRAFEAAARYDLDLDLHVDETQDPASRTLENVAKATLRHGYQGRVTAGHCCSLAVQDDAARARIVDKVAEAGITVVSLPLCNLYLQDRHRQGWDSATYDIETGTAIPARTPRWRGVTALHELKSAGVPVVIASDNTRDPFYAYGDLDMVEVLREATRIAHLDHPISDWPRAATLTPAAVMGEDACGIVEGAPADLVLFSARSWSELLSRPQSDRAVLRSGRPIDTTLPDYRELDALLARKA